MEAKDTTMSPIKLSEVIQHFPDWDLNRGNKFIEELCTYVAKAQAVITFSAGYKQRKKEENPVVLGTDYKAGIRLVADWVNSHQDGILEGQDVQDVAGNSCKWGLTSHLLLRLLEWQDKIKEWGIDDL